MACLLLQHCMLQLWPAAVRQLGRLWPALLPTHAVVRPQVFAKMLQLITTIAQSSPQVGRRDSFVAISGFSDRMADAKLKGPCCEALTALSEAAGPQFVSTQLHSKAAAHKSPKASCPLPCS